MLLGTGEMDLIEGILDVLAIEASVDDVLGCSKAIERMCKVSMASWEVNGAEVDDL